jgi:two-component sensor histidine kinase
MMSLEISGKKELQERLLNQLLKVIAVAGIVAYVPSAYLSVKTQLWFVLIVDTLVFFYAIVLAAFPRLPYRLKIVSVLTIFYGLGLVLVILTGPFGAGHLFIFAFVFLMALFGDIKAMVMANVLAVLTHVGFTAATALHLLRWQQSFDSVLVISVNFILISLILSVSANYLIQGYMKIAVRERDLRQVLELMLNEIEHRVKNNLQVISSLINVRMRSGKDPAKAMEDIKESLSAISAVHRLLYRHDVFYLVLVPALLTTLVDHFRAVHRHLSFSFEWSGPPVEIDMDRAVSLGILVNEIVINSVKHAFRTQDAVGNIAIEAHYDQGSGTLDLKIGDNGQGMDEPPDKPEGSGAKIILAVAQQLQASMIINRVPAVSYQFQLHVVSPLAVDRDVP